MTCEQITLPHDYDRQMIRASAAIGDRALATMDTQYGTGMPLWVPGLRDMPYHNGFHGRQVGRDGSRLAAHMGLDPTLVSLADATGNAHDISSHQGRGIDEAASAEWLVQQMEFEGYFSERYKTMGRLAIIGTEPIFGPDGQVAGQKVSQLAFADRESELFAKSIASADFSLLYRPVGPLVGHLYLQELQPDVADADTFPIEKVTNFQRNQIGLAEGYTYPLAEANDLFATHRQQVIDYSVDMLTKLERGDIDNWQTVLSADQAFMRTHQ